MTFSRYNPLAPGEVRPLLTQLSITPLDLDFDVVRVAAEAQSRFPLNFGDCFAYAHAKLSDDALVTLDANFLKTDLVRLLHPSR